MTSQTNLWLPILVAPLLRNCGSREKGQRFCGCWHKSLWRSNKLCRKEAEKITRTPACWKRHYCTEFNIGAIIEKVRIVTSTGNESHSSFTMKAPVTSFMKKTYFCYSWVVHLKAGFGFALGHSHYSHDSHVSVSVWRTNWLCSVPLDRLAPW